MNTDIVTVRIGKPTGSARYFLWPKLRRKNANHHRHRIKAHVQKAKKRPTRRQLKKRLHVRRVRKLRVKWTPEFVDDAETLYGIADADLVRAMTAEISSEMDRHVLDSFTLESANNPG